MDLRERGGEGGTGRSGGRGNWGWDVIFERRIKRVLSLGGTLERNRKLRRGRSGRLSGLWQCHTYGAFVVPSNAFTMSQTEVTQSWTLNFQNYESNKLPFL